MVNNKNFQMAKAVAEKVKACGGDTYFVGGFVRDRLMGIDSKDIDIEIHRIYPKQLEAILNELGECTVMGASFGVFGLKHYDLDIAVPRKEKATGCGHRDFTIFTDPFLGTEKAAMRRDFTVNAIMQDVLTGEIIDPFGGRDDLKNGIIRHINSTTFAEDPLRVLRAAQFSARFGFSIADETISLCSKMDLSALAKERIMGELEKALIKADKPSVFFCELKKMNQLDYWFPEIKSEDLWEQNMYMLDTAAGFRSQAVHPIWFMLSALCCGIESVSYVQNMLDRLTAHEKLKDYVLNMIELYQMPVLMAEKNADMYTMNTLFDSFICPEDMLLLCETQYICDNGRNFDDIKNFLQNSFCIYKETISRPFVRGSDLIKAGFEPSTRFSDALAYSHNLRLQGIDKKSALAKTTAYLKNIENRINEG